MDCCATAEQSDEFLSLYKEYLQMQYRPCCDRKSASDKIKACSLYEQVNKEGNDVYIPNIDTLAEGIVDAEWSVGHKLMHIHSVYIIRHCSLFTKVLQVYLRKTLALDLDCLRNQVRGARNICHWVLNSLKLLSKHKAMDNIIFCGVTKEERDCVTHLANVVCTDFCAVPFVLILAVMTEDWDLVVHYLQTFSTILNKYMWLLVWLCLCDRVPWKVSEQVFRSMFCYVAATDLRYFSRGFQKACFLNLAWKCRNHNRTNWMMMFYILAGEWQTVESKMEMCEDSEIINFVLLQATKPVCHPGYWLTVWSVNQIAREKLLPFCKRLIQILIFKCFNTKVLLTVFKSAVRRNLSELTMMVLQNLRLQLHEEKFISDFLGSIINYVQDKDVADTLLKMCAKVGMSTRCYKASSILGNSLRRRDECFTTKLLLKIGFVSYTEYVQCVQQQLTPDRDTSGYVLQDIVSEGTAPLVDQCRLTISHAVGFQHGRADRISCLRLADKLKTVIAFEDSF